MSEAKNNNAALKGMNSEKYKVPKGEEKYVHVLIEERHFDKKTGDDHSKRFIVKINPKQYRASKVELTKQHDQLTVLHEPKN